MSVNSHIVDVACGSYATYAVDEQGHTWGWGLNNYGQLGIQGQVGPMWIFPVWQGLISTDAGSLL